MTTSTVLSRDSRRRGGPVPRPPRAGVGTVVALIVAALLLSVVLVPFAAAYRVVSAGGSAATTPTDAIVVLGAAQLNGQPSPVLANRLAHAASLYNAGVAPTIITVGGNQPGDAYTEGEVGREYLIANGIPEDRVIAIESGSDTESSLTAVAQEMAAAGLSSATLVSDPAHMARSEAIADRLGISATTNPTTSGDGSQMTAEYVARETLGYLDYVLVQQWPQDRVIPPAPRGS